MDALRGTLAALALAAAVPAAPALAGSRGARAARTVLSSRELWATIDVCNPPDQPYVVGVRGSMPGDGRAADRMYMSFRLQYLDAASGRWLFLSAPSAFVGVGGARAARQGGSSFQLVAGRAAVTLRGIVQFQWRRGRTVLLSVSRTTTAGHRSLAGADPPDYSAATCLIG